MLCSRYILAACFSLFLFLWLRDSVSRETHIHSWCLEAHIITCFINMASEFSHSLFSRGVEFLVIFPLLSLFYSIPVLSSLPPSSLLLLVMSLPILLHESTIHQSFISFSQTGGRRNGWKCDERKHLSTDWWSQGKLFHSVICCSMCLLLPDSHLSFLLVNSWICKSYDIPV